MNFFSDRQRLGIGPALFQSFDIGLKEFEGSLFLSELETKIADGIPDSDVLCRPVQKFLVLDDGLGETSGFNATFRRFGDFRTVGSLGAHGIKTASVDIVV